MKEFIKQRTLWSPFLGIMVFLTTIFFVGNPMISQNGSQDPGRSPINPSLQSLLGKASAYALNYRLSCQNLVAEEKMVQREIDRKGKCKKQRQFISDYFFVTLPSDPSVIVEVRDTHSIDGCPIPSRKRGLLDIFEKKAANASQEAEQVVKESTKYNLGRKRYSNMINFGLNFLLPEFQGGIHYELLPPGEKSDDKMAILLFQEMTEKTALQAVTPNGKLPIPSHGTIWLSLPEVRILKIDFSFRQDTQPYAIAGRYLVEYQPGPDDLLFPVRFEEYLYDIDVPESETLKDKDHPYDKESRGKGIERLVFQSEASYSNFRKFSSDVRISPADDIR
jgi:hypothetical protein